MTNYTIILAGGKGRRLWPVSRKELPKQFLDIFGTGRTMLQQTFDRFVKIMPAENIFIVTSNAFGSITHEQLPDIPTDNFLLEPVNRNTAPATLMAMRGLAEDAIVTIVPADQMILNEDCFADAVSSGADFVAKHDCVLTMGVVPGRPEPGYGYIQKGEAFTESSELHKVKSFTEKPERDFARMFIESGEFLWNTGIYMARAGYMKEQLIHLLCANGVNPDNEDYSRYRNLSLDLAILEGMDKRAVMECKFGWADIGTWHGIYESIPNNIDDNLMVNAKSHLMASDGASHNVVALPDGKLAVISGLDGYIVAEKDNVLLICPRQDSSAMVRKYLGIVENEDGFEDYI